MIKMTDSQQYGQKIPILYVEDNPNDVLLAIEAVSIRASSLRITGLSCLHRAVNYLTGIGEFTDRHLFPEPALILLDYSLGTEIGTDLVHWMKRQRRLKRIPVVVYSGSDDQRRILNAYGAGADAFLHKTTSIRRLIGIMHAIEQCLSAGPTTMAPLERMPEYRSAPGSLANNRGSSRPT